MFPYGSNDKSICGPRASTTLGRETELRFSSMKGLARRPKFVATGTRRVLADNLRARMEERFAGKPDLVRALSDYAGVSRSTVRRVLEADVIGASIDTITQMANALHCEPYELLMPDRFVARRSRSQGGASNKDRSEPPPARRPD